MLPKVMLGVNDPDYQKLHDRIRNGLPVDALFLDIDAVTGKVIGHEGRHRALLAHSLGIEKVPVILYHYLKDSKGTYRYVSIRNDPFHREAEPFTPTYEVISPRGPGTIRFRPE